MPQNSKEAQEVRFEVLLMSSYPQLLCGVVVSEDPLSYSPVLHGNALQEVVVHIKTDAQREERELFSHHSLHVLLDGAELDLACSEETM